MNDDNSSFFSPKKDEINVLIRNQLKIVVPESFLRSELESCVYPGRKIRSILFLNTLRNLNPQYDSQIAARVILAIELLHAASLLVDDLIDDDYRHNTIAANIEFGDRKALILAHLMSDIAISCLKDNESLQSKFIDTYRCLCIGEMYDALFIPGDWLYEGYGQNVAQKTSSLFEYALFSAGFISNLNIETELLGRVGNGIGTMYQLYNDYYDWQPENLPKRHLLNQMWPITFSFPLAIHLQLFGKKNIESYLAKQYLTFEEWHKFLSEIWSSELRRHCDQVFTSQRNGLIENIQRIGLADNTKQIYLRLISMISKKEYWYKSREA